MPLSSFLTFCESTCGIVRRYSIRILTIAQLLLLSEAPRIIPNRDPASFMRYENHERCQCRIHINYGFQPVR